MTPYTRWGLAIAATAVLFIAGCAEQKTEEYKTNVRGLDIRNFDTSTRACDDFYQFANGGWLARNPVPPAYQRWGVFNEVNNRNEDLLHEILEAATNNPDAEPGSNEQKIGDFFASAMDVEKIEAAGLDPLKPDLARIDAIGSLADLQKVITQFHLEGISSLFDLGVYEDLKDTSRSILYVTQGGLGLPDRDYYVKDDADSKKLREQYVAHVAKMFMLLGEPEADANAHAATVMEIETRLAKASLTRVEARDPNKQYDLVKVSELDPSEPNFSWAGYLADLGLEDVEDLSHQPGAFFKEVNTLLAERSLDDWKVYLRWHLVHAAAPYLSSAFENENFAFYGTALRGTKELLPRWKRALRPMNRYLGEALGQLYVARAFPPEYKARALALVDNLRSVLKERIQNLDWMGEETKKKALEKLATFTPKIGYPDKWRDYSKLQIDRSSYLANVRRGAAFEVRRNLDKIGKPVDKTEWLMNAHTVNAYYNPVKNEIVFPAGILQPPFFDGEIDDPVNYGAFGAVIGHEILHGFDDQGSKFDAQGNLNDWWTEEDRKRFEERTAKLVDQFNAYVAIDDLHVNGKLTLGENIGDLGGVTVSFAALQKALAKNPLGRIDGMTPQQRFFLAYAQAWRANYRPEALRLLVKTNPHAPPKFRTLGPLSNLEGFYKAFGCAPGDGMYRHEADRVKIW